jgi:hypothetical protein
MNNRLFLYLFQLRAFWSLRHITIRALFWIEARIFSIRYGGIEEKHNYNSIQYIFRITQKQMFFAICFAVLIQYIDQFRSNLSNFKVTRLY